jgi:hypothetical protein
MSDTHPEPAEIAALDADLLPPDEAALLRDHLADCASCASIQADLDALGRELVAIPSPPMPADVAARIDAALMAEAAAATVSRETRDTAPQRRWPRMVLAAAAALVALGLGGTLIQTADLGTGTDEEASTEAAHGDSDLSAEEGGGDPLEARVRGLLARTGGSPGDGGSSTSPSPQSNTTAGDEESGGPGTASLPSCVLDAINRPEEPLAAGEETYQGQDAYLVVLPHAADADRVDAYVVDADCAAEGPRASGEILAQATYPLEQ